MDTDLQFELTDVYEDSNKISCNLKITDNGISISFDGYNDNGAENILIEFANEHPSVVIWGDSDNEEPTHVISLEGAKK